MKGHKICFHLEISKIISELFLFGLCPLYASYLSEPEGGSKVRLHELMGTLKDTAKLGNLKKQLNVVNKRRKVVAVPLPKHEKQKVG